MNTTTIAGGQFLTAHPVPSVVLAIAGLVVVFLLLRRAVRALARGVSAGSGSMRRSAGRVDRGDALTYVAASIATGVAAQGMWRFFGDVLHFETGLRAGMFAFIEIAVITSAVRARRNMREHHAGGVDGAAVWVLTGLSATLSAMDARSFPEAVFRLLAPLVAAWLWERGMAVERRRLTGRTGIHWRITPERILVRLGLAEASGRTAGQVDTERRLTRLALAAKHARTITATAKAGGWRQRRALARLDTAMRQAVTHTALAADPDQQQHLLLQLGALTNAATLLALTPPAPWQALIPASATNTDDDEKSTEADDSGSGGPGDQGDEVDKVKRRSTRRTGGPAPVAVKVARLRARYPDWTVGQIAERAGVSERTARRHLNARPPDETAATADDVAA